MCCILSWEQGEAGLWEWALGTVGWTQARIITIDLSDHW